MQDFGVKIQILTVADIFIYIPGANAESVLIQAKDALM